MLKQLNKFKATNNNWKTRALFADINKISAGGDSALRPEEAFYYLFDKDDAHQDPRPLLKDKFLELRDPTGIKLANKWLGGFEHFQALMKASWFKDCWQDWQDELDSILKTEALEVIKTIMVEGSTQSFAAAKFIATGEYKSNKEGKTSKRGRPSKEEVQGELKKAVKAFTQTEEDYQRMMNLTVIQGGKKN